MRINIQRLILFALVGVFVAQLIFYYPNLGETVSTHFDAFGRPNGFMRKDTFVIFEFALLVLILGETLLIPVVIEKLPTRLLNLPNRDHWLADERREATYGSIRTFFELLGMVMVAFFIVVNQMVFRANVLRENLPTWLFLAVVSAFVAFVIAWVIKLARSFRLPK